MTKSKLQTIAIEQLERGRFQPRRDFDDLSLTELAESIRSTGLIQPIVVRQLVGDQYEIIAGERRWRAAQRAGLTTVQCLVENYNDEQASAVTAIENIQRKDLNPIEEASNYQQMIEEFGYKHEEVAAIVGISRSKVTNMLRLLELEESVKGMLIQGKLTIGHGKCLASLPKQQQMCLAHQCISDQWSVGKLEIELKKLNRSSNAIVNDQSLDVARLEQKITDQLGSTVKIQQDGIGNGGALTIKYFNHEILAGILDQLGVEYE